MKKINSWKDISIKWDDAKERFIVNLRPLGIKPSRAPPLKPKRKLSALLKARIRHTLIQATLGLVILRMRLVALALAMP